MGNSRTDNRYLDSSLPLEERVSILLGQMTLEEKVGIMLHEAKGVERLNIPDYNWWNECLHGVARAGRATVFPQAISLAACFDDDLLREIAEAIADEARAKYHAAARAGVHEQYLGLTFWTPNVNIFRDPRWGRGQETYGEDPFLTSRLGVAFVKGLQGDHPKYLKAAACAKHFAVHSGPESKRHTFDVRCSVQDLWETYLPAFEALVREAGVEAVMGAYNRTNGEPCCAHSVLMEEILRGKWQFGGHYVSDCWAIRDFHENHKVTADVYESCALAIGKGCDLNCGNSYPYVLGAVDQGLLTESEIDRSAARLLRTWFRLGFFDDVEDVPFSKVEETVVNCPRHRALSLQAAEKGMVLLKNKGAVLPLSLDCSFMVTGTNATSVDVLLGNYYGLPGRATTILEGIAGKLPPWKRVEYRAALRPETPNVSPKDWVSYEATRHDAIIAVLGNSPLMEGEEGDAIASPLLGDTDNPSLPGHQVEYLRMIKAAGAKLILVLCGGSSFVLGEAEELADAILWAGYPGEAGGEALANLLFGHTNPSGKLPLTYYAGLDSLPDYEDYSMEGRTYRFMKDPPLYPFGYGLSYSRFQLGPVDQKTSGPASLVFAVDLTNLGPINGEEVVQLYLRPPKANFRTPTSALRAFRRVRLDAGETARVEFTLERDCFSMVDQEGNRTILKDDYELVIGLASPGKRSEELGVPFSTCKVRPPTGPVN